MFRNYLKVALRNLFRHKGFTIINILGLAIGITGCLVIILFVWDELQYDKFIKGGENIYRVYTRHTDEQGTNSMSSVPPMYATYIKQQFPEVDNTLRIIMLNGKMLLEEGDKKSYEENWMATENSFFKFFPLKFVNGDPLTSLNERNSIVITSALSKKYFGKMNPIGKTISINKDPFLVKGVLQPLPEHFHLKFDFLISIQSLGIAEERMQSWRWNQFYTYIKVKPGTDINLLQRKFSEAVQKQSAALEDKTQDVFKPQFQQLKNIHLQSSDFKYDNAKRGNETYVKALSIIALFVLIIACFNFINLATARSFRRSKEIGVRKVIGAERKQLILQFTGESILLSFISIIIATIATLLLVPMLNNFSDKSISFNPFTHPLIGLLLVIAAVCIGLFAGIYPAIILSGFKAISVLKGSKSGATKGSKSSWLREGLVITQFAVSALLIICAIVVYKQINFLHEKNLGFNKDQVMFFPMQGSVDQKAATLKEEILRSPNVVSATAGYGLPGDVYAGDQVILPGTNGDKNQSTTLFIGDADYIKTLGLQIVAGRDFSKLFPTDVDQAFIINETAVKEFGFGTPQNALNKPLKWKKWETDSLHPIKEGKVIGVVKDFHYSSLHEKVGSLVLQQDPAIISTIAVKIKAADIANTIAFINKTWAKFSPEYPLDYKFLDESFSKMYKAEEKLGSLLLIFTVMAIFVGCLGLFGLAAFTAEQRTKEIGIRKVLGATVTGITSMLSSAFLKPVLIASLIASPIAWWIMNKWLQDFSYRIDINWGIFIIASLVMLLIALITVSFQAIKAAIANPVKSLRTE